MGNIKILFLLICCIIFSGCNNVKNTDISVPKIIEQSQSYETLEQKEGNILGDNENVKLIVKKIDKGEKIRLEAYKKDQCIWISDNFKIDKFVSLELIDVLNGGKECIVLKTINEKQENCMRIFKWNGNNIESMLSKDKEYFIGTGNVFLKDIDNDKKMEVVEGQIVERDPKYNTCKVYKWDGKQYNEMQQRYLYDGQKLEVAGLD